MALNFQQISLKDISRGIDSRSTENSIADGYAEDLLNVDTNSQGFLSKRKGYVGHDGDLPLRVTEVSQSGTTTLTICFDPSINLLSTTPGPIVVHGRLEDPPASGDWSGSTDAAVYYSTYSIQARRTLLTGANTITLSNETGSTNLLSALVQATSPSSLSNSFLLPDTVQISQSGDFDVDFNFNNGSGSSLEGFVYISDQSTVTGSSFATDIVWGTPAGGITFPTADTMLIPANVHNLTDVNVIPQLYYDTGSEWESLLPDNFIVKANGDIEIQLVPAPTGTSHKVVLADAVSFAEAGVTNGISTTIDQTPDSGSVFFTAVYLRDEITGDRELILPDAITYDATTNTLSFDVTPTADGVLQVMHLPGNIQANCIEVTDTTAATPTFSSTSQQLSVWGILHENIHDSSTSGGHVHHIDSYRRELEARMVAGVGGVFHTARTRAEAGAEYLIPAADVALQERTDAVKVVGPVFHTTGDTTGITRAIFADEVAGNFAEVESAEYTGTANQVKFTLKLTNKVGDLDTSVTTDDLLTVQGMAFRKLNGTFSVLATDNANNTITVEIDGITTSDFNEVGACGKAGIFTDVIELAATSPFAVGDSLKANIFDGIADPEVISVAGSDIVVSGLTEDITIPGGLLLRGARTSNIIPLSDVTDFVPGDIISLTGYTRHFRVLSIDTSANTLTIDESVAVEDLEGDSFFASVVGRWIPTQAPNTQQIQVRQYDSDDYTSQSTVRSTMVNDNLYLTNGRDEVYKFDGTHSYRAGLPRWQPQLFVTLDPTVESILTPPAVAALPNGASSSDSVLEVDSSAALSVDQQILIEGNIYTVESINSPTEIAISPSLSTSPAANTFVFPLRRLQYYFRLHAIDANQNIISSATTGANDYIVNLTQNGQIKFKLVGMPEWDAYDIDTIEVQVFRADFGTGLFNRVYATKLSFSDVGYLEFTDSIDEPSQADEVSVILETNELGNTWGQPLRAKYITTINNRTILANITDYAEISVNLRQSSGTPITVANLANKIFLLRKSSQDSGTTTDMINRANYEFIDTVGDTANRVVVSSASITTTATTFTIPSIDHNLSVGDWVYLYHATAGTTRRLRFAGWWQISAVPNTNSFTITADVGAVTADADDVDRYITATTPTDIPVLLGTDGNYNNTTGNSSLSYERLAMIRLANAINATMRVTNKAISGQENFVPWIIAAAGDELGLGSMTLRAPRADITHGMVLAAAVTNGTWVVNQTVRAGGENIAARTRLFPSRVISSFANYNEIFDAPFGLESDSSLVFDVDPADGQQVTAVLPFFAQATFSGSQVEDMLVVFKQNSIHVQDIATGQRRRLETQGIGCTAPYSVALSRNGIIFAHTSGVYRLGRDLNITYVGKFIERKWQEDVIDNGISLATGTHFALGRKYKLSVPFGDSQTTNNQVLVYDHTRETDQRVEFGAWTRYDNHPVTGWANLDNDAYFASTGGRVFKLRNENDATDYRDDSSAITETITYTPMDFGLPGIIKVIKSLTLQFQLRFSDLSNTQVSAATDLSAAFQTLDSFDLVRDPNLSGLDQLALTKVQSVRFELPRRRCEYLQLKITNSGFDENMIVAGMTFNVGAVSTHTIASAAEVTAQGIK